MAAFTISEWGRSGHSVPEVEIGQLLERESPLAMAARATFAVQLELVEVLELAVVAEEVTRDAGRGAVDRPLDEAQTPNAISATPTLAAKIRSSAPALWRWPAATDSFQAWSSLRENHREHQRREAAEHDGRDSGGHEAGQIVDLRADPQPAGRLGAEEAQAQQQLDGEQRMSQQPRRRGA